MVNMFFFAYINVIDLIIGITLGNIKLPNKMAHFTRIRSNAKKP